MSARIRPLSQFVADQIAAGEVVDAAGFHRQELLENSLDAAATHVRIDVENAGVKRIRVRDDGVGIHADDLRLAVARHATSKIEPPRIWPASPRLVSAAKRWRAPPRWRSYASCRGQRRRTRPGNWT